MNNKIDDFFKKRLDTNSSEDEMWNIPSEDMWEAAKPHFPKEKKRRRFLWIYFLVVVMLISSITFWSMMDFDRSIQDHAKVAISIDVPPKAVDSKKIDSYNDKALKIKSENIQNDFISKENVKTEALKGAAITNQKNTIINNANIANTTAVENEIERELRLKSIKNEVVTENRESESEIVGQFIDEPMIVDFSLNSHDSSSTKFIESYENDTDNRSLLTEAIGINSIYTTIVDAPKASLIGPQKSIFTVPYGSIRPQEEIGVSSQYFFMSLLNGKDLDDSPEGRVIFDGSYNNLNLKYTKWIARKWSLSTGVNLASLSVNIDFDTEVVYNETDFEEIIESEYGEFLNRNYDPSSSKIVRLKPGVELLDGDLLMMSGQVDLGLKVMQIPIILNYHWYNKRVEFYTGVGVTLESVWASEKNANFELFQDGTLITDPENQNDVEQHYWDYSYYTKLGSKFNITSHVNLDINLSILVNQPIFSGVEIGLHYRWYQ